MHKDNIRIAKYIANSNYASRRKAEELIERGQVMVNNKIVRTPVYFVQDEDVVSVEGNIIDRETERKLFLYHKPPGFICSYNDEKGRPTIYSHFQGLPRLFSIGRLDFNSEGLLMMTNDGQFAQYMMQPKNLVSREYIARVYHKNAQINNIPELRDEKIKINGEVYSIKLLQITKKGKTNSWFKIVLQEGKNREIRQIFEHFGMQVARLIRTKYGRWELGSILAGHYVEVKGYN